MKHLVERLTAIRPDEIGEALQLGAWRRRVATVTSAVLVGLFALGFARAGDMAQGVVSRFVTNHAIWMLLVTPAVFTGLAWLTARYASETSGSGIPQVIAASADPDGPISMKMHSLRAALGKIVLTIGGLLGGASVGREGPTVQVGTAIMVQVHRLLRVPITAGVLIAGGAAGVAAAFNTPLAGIAFAIEELAVAYEQRVAVLAMAAVMISGLTAAGIAGDYLYFGHMSGSLPLTSVLLAAPLAGIGGGMLGGLFSRFLLMLRGSRGRWSDLVLKNPLMTGLVTGVIVAVIGVASAGLTWGTGYGATRALLTGGAGWLWFGPAKFIATLATSASGIPGGIFAPSLAVGAGFGEFLTPLFPRDQAGAIVLLGMAGYFVGVVRAPLTAVIILSEATGTSNAILPLFATALIGDWAGSLVCKERLYHALSRSFAGKRDGEHSPEQQPKG